MHAPTHGPDRDRQKRYPEGSLPVVKNKWNTWLMPHRRTFLFLLGSDPLGEHTCVARRSPSHDRAVQFVDWAICSLDQRERARVCLSACTRVASQRLRMAVSRGRWIGQRKKKPCTPRPRPTSSHPRLEGARHPEETDHRGFRGSGNVATRDEPPR